MIEIRRSEERGFFDHGWLRTRHTFSFADYFDPKHLGFRSLRVINEDWIEGGRGFGKHPHRDMEIVTYVLEGALEHEDSSGGGGVIRPGRVQRMSAGRGVVHSEFNHSADEEVHLLQIWIHPEEKALDPGYEEMEFPFEERKGRLRLIASRNAEEGSLTIHQDARVFASILDAAQSVDYDLSEGRGAFLQLARGSLRVNGGDMKQGDGAAIVDEGRLVIEAIEDAEFLLFDLK